MTTYAPSSQAGLATFAAPYRYMGPLDARSYTDPFPTLPKPATIVVPPVDRVVVPVVYPR